jgi:valyl-tRNA synthetase
VVPADVVDATAVAEVDWLVRLISAIRSARTELNVPPSAQIGAHVAGASAETAARLERHQAALLRLARLSGVSTAPVDTQGAIQVVVDEATFVLPVADLIDLAAEKARLAKSAEKARKEAAGIAGRLGNAQFIEKAKPEVVEDAREKLAELTAQADRLDAALNALG